MHDPAGSTRLPRRRPLQNRRATAAATTAELARQPTGRQPRRRRVAEDADRDDARQLQRQRRRAGASSRHSAAARCKFLKSGDAGLALNKAILSKGNPLADVFYGVDNTFLTRALAADIFEPYASPALAKIPADLQLDPGNRALPSTTAT